MENKTEEAEKGQKPDFKGSLDVAGWIDKDKNGKEFINIKIGNYARLFKQEK